jgi:hypothetical protein
MPISRPDHIRIFLRFDFYLPLLSSNLPKTGISCKFFAFFFSQIYTKFCQIYQEVFSFFQTILDYFSNYFGPIFEDITAMSEQLPKKIKEEMTNAAHSSIEEILHLQDLLVFEFSLLRREIADIPASVCKKLSIC